MKESLEQFINTNRNNFDEEQPPVRLWDNITENMSTKKKAKTIFFYRPTTWAAASIITVLGVIGFLIAENNSLRKNLTASKQQLQQQTVKNEPAAIDYNKEINQFMQIVANRQNQLSSIKKEHPSLYRSFTADVNDLNKEYENLKKELAEAPEQDEILDAMILNLKLQAELLNEQLLIIHQLKTSKIQSNEKAAPVI